MRFAWVGVLLWAACERSPSPQSSAIFLAERLDDADKGAEAASLSEFRSMPWTLDNETRLSVVTPLASRVSYSVSLPDDPVLKFAIALFPLGNPESTTWDTLRTAEFRVDVESGGARETVFTAPVRRHEAGKWIDYTLDLGRFAGRTVRLELESTPPSRFLRDPRHLRVAREQYLALWGNPVLDSRNVPAAATNVILISLDCVRADHIGVYGYPNAKTPNIDAFARDGVVFETAITTAPSTLPAHTSILTGLTPLLHEANTWRRRNPAVPYLPEVLSLLGFEVNGVVTGPYLSQTFGLEGGFHSYKFLFDPRASEAIDAAVEVLSRASGRRQFLFVHLFDAHAPYLAPREFLPRMGEVVDISSLLERTAKEREPNEEDRRSLIALYDAEIAYVDSQVGRFLEELKSRALYDSSLIILTADHGEAFYEHGHRQHSRTLYEEMTLQHLKIEELYSLAEDPGDGTTSSKRERTHATNSASFSPTI